MGKAKGDYVNLLLVATTILTAFFILQQGLRDFVSIFSAGVQNVSSLLPAMLVYAASQCMRFLRFALLLGPFRIRQLAKLYLVTTGASLAIPFKLGEVARLYWIARETGSLRQSVLIIWVERLLDASLIALAYAVLSSSSNQPLMPPTGALYAIPPIILISILVFRVLPENIKNLNLWIMRSYKGAAAIRRLHILQSIASFTDEANKVLRNKFSSIVGLTICIWFLECFSLQVILTHPPLFERSVSILINKLVSIAGSQPTSQPFFESNSYISLITYQSALISIPATLAILNYLRQRIITMRQQKSAV